MQFNKLFLIGSLVLLSACSDKAKDADTAATPQTEPGTEVAASPDAAAPGIPGADEGKRGGPDGIGPMAMPKIVTDTTPVDTQVVDVKLSDKGDGKNLTGIMTDQFKPADGVFMSIHTDGSAEKFTLSAKWLTPSGEKLTEYSQIISGAGPQDTQFSLSKPDGWAKGAYTVELSINGKMLRKVPFTIK